MPNYRKKPIIIEARQFPTDGTPAVAHAIYQWVEKNTLGSFEPLAVIEGREPWPESGVTIDPRDGRMVIATLEGGHWVTPGDFIIRGVQGEFYPCKSDIFEATYEPAETTPAHHETPDVAELRRLAEAATPGPWDFYRPHPAYRAYSIEQVMPEGHLGEAVAVTEEGAVEDNAAYIAAASPDVVLGLLDRLAHMTEARDNARAEVERLAGEQEVLSAAVDRVRELHARESFWQYDRDQEHSYLTQQDAADESGCDCPYAPEPSADLAHTPECLATISHFDVCSECARIEYADAERQAHGEFSGYAEALWPCPTIRALDGEPQS